MKNRIFTIFTLLFLCTTLYAQQLEFVAKKDFTWTSIIGKEYHISKDEILHLKANDGIGFSNPDDTKELYIILYKKDNPKALLVNIEDVTFTQNTIQVSDEIRQSYWVPSYYYEQLKNKNDKFSIIYKNEPFWASWKNQYENPATLLDDFNLGYYGFSDFYIFLRNSQKGKGECCFLVSTESSSVDFVKYKVYKMYSNAQLYSESTAHPQENFLPLYEKETPFYIYLIIDGDYMKMYIDEVSEENLFQTLIRTTPEACNQIEKWIKGESNDLSKVVMPKHGNPSVQTEVTKTNATNVAPNKTMTVSENLKLRSGEATTSEVITVMSAGTKVKILELGKAENIDGINSNWVKVEVQAGAKDRDGNTISRGTVGWCYGGYLE
jgi:uncharacterized protein YgiM (DUF1202 family)